MARRTSDKVRELTADELGIGGKAAIQDHSSNRPDDPPLRSDDPRLLEVRDLLQTYGGIIFSGPPGTSKSWYAAKTAEALGDGAAKRGTFVHFHLSYHYKAFFEGLDAKEAEDAFELIPRDFLQMRIDAGRDRERLYVLVIDELSR